MIKHIAFLLILVLGSSLPCHADEVFFPKKLVEAYEGDSEFVEKWYSRHLRAMGEVPIFGSKSGTEIYRFTWLRTFHKPMVFRLEILAKGDGRLFVKQSHGKGGYDPGRIELDKQLPISADQVQEFKNGLVSFDFWNMARDERDDFGMDGAQWILEGKKGLIYHVVDRWNPGGDNFAKTMLMLVALSGEKVGEVY